MPSGDSAACPVCTDVAVPDTSKVLVNRDVLEVTSEGYAATIKVLQRIENPDVSVMVLIPSLYLAKALIDDYLK